MNHTDSRFVHLVVGQSLVDFLHRDPGLETRQTGPETKVNAEAKGQVLRNRSIDIEATRIVKLPGVVIRRSDQENDPVTGRNR